MARRKSTPTTDNTDTQETTVSDTATAFDPRALASNIVESTEEITRTRNDGREKYADNPYIDFVQKSRDTGQTLGFDVPSDQAAEINQWLRNAAQTSKNGLSVRFFYTNGDDERVSVVLPQKLPVREDKEPYTVHIAFKAGKPRDVKERQSIDCPVCGKSITVNADKKIRVHQVKGGKTQCEAGDTPVANYHDDTDQNE